jgi:hypothetical protein
MTAFTLPRISWLSAGAPARKLHQLHKLTSTACQGGNFNSISKIITTKIQILLLSFIKLQSSG